MSARKQIQVGGKVYIPTLWIPRPHPEHDMTVVALHRDGRIVETEQGDFLASELSAR